MNFKFINHDLKDNLKDSFEFIPDNFFYDLSYNLSETKKLIDQYPHIWEKVKKNIHLYEYVYTSSYLNKNISYFQPISRSYFKLKEILYDYNIDLFNNQITSLAEAPGGFIQCLLEYFNNDIKINAITLLSENKKIPRWNRRLINHKQINFLYGDLNNGDLYDLNNVLSIIKNIKKNNCSLVTGDGGFDNSDDYNNQELNSLKLIYSEIFLALNIQIKNGTFICKIFDIFLNQTISLLYILYLSYNEIYIHKPLMSRLSNSEKYIICKGYKGYNKNIINLLIHHYDKNDLNLKIPKSFLNQIYQFNNNYTNEQIKHIKKGIDIIESNTIDKNPSKDQIDKAIFWCEKYNIPINNNCFYLK